MPTEIDSNVLLDFLLTFARFELSLKNSGFVRSHKKIDLRNPPDAHADWDRFAVSIRDSFRGDRTTALQEACDYLLSTPPWREVVIGKKSVGWRCDPPPESLPEAGRVLLCIRRLRNNLFHGATLSPDQGYDKGTTKSLLKASMVVLEECLLLSPKVQEVYKDAALYKRVEPDR
jgi:hypothetical protein